MKNIKSIKMMNFILLSSCFFTLLVGCNDCYNDSLTDKDKTGNQVEQEYVSSADNDNLTDKNKIDNQIKQEYVSSADNDNLINKEKFINQLKQDFVSTSDNQSIEFTAETFAQLVNLSACFSIDLKIFEDSIYVQDTLYSSISIISSPNITCNNAFFRSVNKSITDEEVFTVLQKIQSSESYYMLETESANSKSKKIAVYIIDEKYYFASLSNDNELIRIHYVNKDFGG